MMNRQHKLMDMINILNLNSLPRQNKRAYQDRYQQDMFVDIRYCTNNIHYYILSNSGCFHLSIQSRSLHSGRIHYLKHKNQMCIYQCKYHLIKIGEQNTNHRLLHLYKTHIPKNMVSIQDHSNRIQIYIHENTQTLELGNLRHILGSSLTLNWYISYKPRYKVDTFLDYYNIHRCMPLCINHSLIPNYFYTGNIEKIQYKLYNYYHSSYIQI